MSEQLTVDDDPDGVGPGECVEDIPASAGGRHRLHRFPGRAHAMKVLYGDDEVVAVHRAAAEAGLRPSSYVAAAALAAATGEKPPTGSMHDRQALAELMRLRTAVRQYGINLNQIAAALNSGRGAPVWLEQAVAGGDRAVAQIDEAAQIVARRLS
jgi:hypothetical protein